MRIWYLSKLLRLKEWSMIQLTQHQCLKRGVGLGACMKVPATVHATGFIEAFLDQMGRFPKATMETRLEKSLQGGFWEIFSLKTSDQHLFITHELLCEHWSPSYTYRHTYIHTYNFLHFLGFFTKIRLSCIHVIN